MNKTNEQYLLEIRENRLKNASLKATPYQDIYVLSETKQETTSYKDEDGDYVHDTNTVVVRETLVSIKEDNAYFVIDNWFDSIDNFGYGLYAKVKLGFLYNLIRPDGVFVLPFWYNEIVPIGEKLFFGKRDIPMKPVLGIMPPLEEQLINEDSGDLYDKRGKLLLDRVSILSEYQSGRAVINKEGKYNFIDEEGVLILKDWSLGALPFKGGYAFIKDSKGWHIIDITGQYALPFVFTSVDSFLDSDNRGYGQNAIAMVGIDGGKNIILSTKDYNKENLQLWLGFLSPVSTVKFFHQGTSCLVNNKGSWFVSEWAKRWNKMETKKELGQFEVIGDLIDCDNYKLYLVNREGKFNLVGIDGFVFKDWYSEISFFGHYIKVRQDEIDSDSSCSSFGVAKTIKSKYNILSPSGYSILDEWCDEISVLTVDGCHLVNVKSASSTNSEPTNFVAVRKGIDIDEIKGRIIGREGRNIRALESFTGAIISVESYSNEVQISSSDSKCREAAYRTLLQLLEDNTFNPTHIEEIATSVRKQLEEEIKAGLKCNELANDHISLAKYSVHASNIQGKCRLLKDYYSSEDQKEFSDWYDAVEILDGKLFIDGLVKVWKNNKCNLMDCNGHFVSSEWVDDFILIEKPYPTYYSPCLDNAFAVKKDRQLNLIYKGHYVLDHWFTRILPCQKNHSVTVTLGNKEGLYILGHGLLGDKLYDSVSRIDENLYLCVDTDKGSLFNETGRFVSSGPYVEVGAFWGEYAKVYSRCRSDKDCTYNYIDKNGVLVSTEWYDLEDDSKILYGDREYFDSNDDFTKRRQGPVFTIVKKGSKYNVLNKDRRLLFKNWYDNIEGKPGKWIVCENHRGQSRINFVDNNGFLLSKEWFKGEYSLRCLDEGYHVVSTDKGYNIIDPNGLLTLPFWSEGRIEEEPTSSFPAIYISGNRYFYDLQCLFLTRYGKLIAPTPGNPKDVKDFYVKDPGSESNEFVNLTVFRFNLSGSDGKSYEIVCRRDGTPYFETKYERIDEYHISSGDGDYFLVKILDNTQDSTKGGYMILDNKGKACTHEYFESIHEFKDGYAVVEKNGKYNLLNESFSLVSSLWFDSLGFNYTVIEKQYEDDFDEDGYAGSIERDVKAVKLDTSFHAGYLKVKLSGNYNYLSSDGKLKFNQWFDNIRNINDYYDIVRLNNKYNVVDAEGRNVSEEWFDSIKICLNNFGFTVCACKKEELIKLLIISDNHLVLSDVWVDKVFKYRDTGFYPVRLQGKKNFITDEGKLLMPSWYDDQLLFREFSNSYVVVEDNGRKNIYSCSESKMLITEWVQDIVKVRNGWKFTLFDENGLCCVRIHDGYTYINQSGTFLTKDVFETTYGFINGFAGVARSSKKNYLNTEGVLISDVWFDEISPFTMYKKAVVRINDHINVIDDSGALLLPNISGIRSIYFDNDKYCSLVFEDGSYSGQTKFFVYDNSTIFDNEFRLREFLTTSSADSIHPSTSEIIPSQVDKEVEKAAINRKEFCRNNQLQIVSESDRDYCVVSSHGKNNVLDKDNNYVFNEWIDPAHLLLCQDNVLVLNEEGNWQIVT